jgi:pseudouridine-5'-phosphate glycosidase
MLIIAEEVAKALKSNQPVVALESTIITHGMPYPENLVMAKSVEEVVRAHGAIPATIALIQGDIYVGLTEHLFDILAQGKHNEKISSFELPVMIAMKKSGGTTVAATMKIAHDVGIKVFATGGIGGVHRNVMDSWDISHDLESMSLYDVTVVSAGAKAILDLPKTLEYLETKGVLIVGFKTHEFPAFYSNNSGLFLKHRCDDPFEIARIMDEQTRLNISGGLLVANPIPEKYALDATSMNIAIQTATEEVFKKQIKGHQVTPYLLARMKELTDGESLTTNVQLVLNNARVASDIAKAYSDLVRSKFLNKAT